MLITKKIKVSFLIIFFLFTLTFANYALTSAYGYPEKNVNVIVAYKPGGGSDTTARILCNYADKYVPTSFVIFNKPGGGGAIGQQYGALAEPDGYTLTLITTSLTIHPLLKEVKYDYKSFEPIIQVTEVPDILMVRREDNQLNTIKKFLEYAKKNPEVITIATSGRGSTDHFTALSLEKEAGLKFSLVPYGADAKVGLLGGHVSAAVGGPEDLRGMPDLKAIIVFSEDRIPELPNVPTAKELGINWVSSVWRGMAAPKGTPSEVVNYLHDVFKKVLEDGEFQIAMKKIGMRAIYLNGENFTKKIENQAEKYKELLSTTK